MKIRKLIALIMAFAMLLSYSVCAFAQPVSLADLVKQIAAPGTPAESDAMPDISQLGALMPLLGALGLTKTAELPDAPDLSSLVPQPEQNFAPSGRDFPQLGQNMSVGSFAYKMTAGKGSGGHYFTWI